VADRALITGVSSFAGSKLAGQLLESGWTVAGTVRTRTSGLDGVTETNLDIADQAGLESLIEALRPDVVFHLAAIVDTVETPSIYELQRVNVLGTVAVVEAIKARAPQARLVYASSAFAYGQADDSAMPLTEEQPIHPLTPYGSGKAASEAIVEQHAVAGGDAVIARAFQHSGDGHVGAYALSDWAAQLARIERGQAEPRILVGNLDAVRDYLDVVDVAAAYMALGISGRAGAVYNVCSGEPVSMRELLEGLIAAFGLDIEIETDPSRMRPSDQPRFFGSPARLAADTGWRPQRTRSQMLSSLVEFWRARG
jgi:GDP-4-dehydro-6-deoxy-D-mannose reductase